MLAAPLIVNRLAWLVLQLDREREAAPEVETCHHCSLDCDSSRADFSRDQTRAYGSVWMADVLPRSDCSRTLYLAAAQKLAGAKSKLRKKRKSPRLMRTQCWLPGARYLAVQIPLA
jgi:hypothetical protein